jgi:hypothetical protein
MGYGLWVMSSGLWVMGYEFWVMGYGLWVMGYGRFANCSPLPAHLINIIFLVRTELGVES